VYTQFRLQTNRQTDGQHHRVKPSLLRPTNQRPTNDVAPSTTRFRDSFCLASVF